MVLLGLSIQLQEFGTLHLKKSKMQILCQKWKGISGILLKPFHCRAVLSPLLSNSTPGITKDLAWKIVGILFTNCFEFKIAEIDARALYPLVSLVNHSCIPNMHHTNLINQLEALPATEGQARYWPIPIISHDLISTNYRLEGEIVVMQLEAQRTILPNTELTIRYNDYMMVRKWEEHKNTTILSMILF